MNIIQRQPETLITNPIQPPSRTTDRAQAALIETIIESNFIAPIVICGDTVVDGHRRLAAAIKLGAGKFPTIDCVSVDGEVATPIIWFAWLNRATRNMKGSDWFFIWARSSGASGGTRSLTMKKIPAKTRGKIEDMVAIFGKARAIEIGREGKQSPDVAGYIRSALRALTNFNFMQGSEDQTRQLGEWMLKHQQTNASRDLLQGRGIDSRQKVEKLYHAVKSDKPLIDVNTGKKFRLVKAASR